MAPIIVVAGPTASGKTSQAIELAKQHQAIVLAADSRMVYRGLDIGTGKPTWEYRTLTGRPWLPPVRQTAHGPVYRIDGIEHALLDVIAAGADFSLADWLGHARALIAQAQRASQPVIVTGGTGLYLKALIDGYELPPIDPAVRQTLEQRETAELYAELKQTDPITADREQANRRRLVRALEVVRLTGRPFAHRRRHRRLPIDLHVLRLPRPDLSARIDARIEERLKAGLVAEVEGLLAQGLAADWLIKLGLEYRVITTWLQTGGGDADLVAQLRRAIHAYARRQETFIRTQLAEA